MKKSGSLQLFGSLACFAVFFANVSVGAAGMGVFLGDVAEMLALFAAALLFVAGILMREADQKSTDNQTKNNQN